jgi:hypothetical protein
MIRKVNDEKRNAKGTKMNVSTGKKQWTITYVAKNESVDSAVVVRGDSASHAKNQLRNRREVQYVKDSREYVHATDAALAKI